MITGININNTNPYLTLDRYRTLAFNFNFNFYYGSCSKCSRCRCCESIDVHDTHYLLLLCGDVERNPGPNESGESEIVRKTALKLMTQNCRGLQDRDKVRQLLKNKNFEFKEGKAILALQETHLMNDMTIKWSGNYVITSSTSPHSAGCITYLNNEVRVIEVNHIDDEGHGHVIVIEGLEPQLTIIANVYSPVRSLPREQELFYEKLISIIDEMEQKYILNEPGLILMGDFNLPLELDMDVHNYNASEVARARELVESLKARGLTDCWINTDDRYTFRTGESRLDRILYRFDRPYREKLETIWTFTSSDHCLLKLSLMVDKEKYQKSRVTALPTYLLDNKEAINLIREKMIEAESNCGGALGLRLKTRILKDEPKNCCRGGC
jgi:exonuclease III